MKIKRFEPNFIVTFKAKNGKLIRVESRKKMKILGKIRTTFAKEGELRCIYGRAVENSAPFNSYTEAHKLIKDWTDKQMEQFIMEGEW